MNNNEVLTNLREHLKFDDHKFIEILALADVKVSSDELASWFKAKTETEYADLSDKMMAIFLDALILYKRGKESTNVARPLETPITNNIVLKKLRVAFALEESDIADIMQKADPTIAPKAWSTYFRKQGHKNYRVCPDPFLEAIMKGLTPSKNECQ